MLLTAVTPAPGILFLCVANSSRSQMAEGCARAIAPGHLEIYSAGSEPTHVNPLAVEAMREVGVDISGQRSKSVDAVERDSIGTVITLCDEEVCPVFAGNVVRHHWPFGDPAAEIGSEAQRLDAFRKVRDQIRARLETYFAGLGNDTA